MQTEQKPGRRRAAPPPRRFRSRPEGTVTEAPTPRPLDGPPAQPQGSTRRWRPSRPLVHRVTVVLWFLAVGAGLVGVVLPWTPVAVPDGVPLAGAVAVTTLFTYGLAVRTGGRPLIAGGLALALATAAALMQTGVLLAGAAVGTTVVAAILAVMSTTPAARFVAVIKEVLVATAVAVVGAFAVHAYGAQTSVERTSYLVIGISLLGALALVFRLGAGLHGLGRRGFVMIVSGVVLLTVALAYTEALAQWGSPAMTSTIDQASATVRDVLGATPRPIEVLLGFPALAWGVSTRARRRQGWWVCAFGAVGFAVVSVSLLDPTVSLQEAGLSLVYSLVLGLVLGYAVIRADLFLTGARGRRARQLEELAAHRPEPGRLRPLL
jgi:hypothetical protein